jgi:hypothetical protein
MPNGAARCEVLRTLASPLHSTGKPLAKTLAE